jgi:hypothetical protein
MKKYGGSEEKSESKHRIFVNMNLKKTTAGGNLCTSRK